MLGQIDDHGNEYMVACISRSLNVHERNYGSPQGEMLAAVWAIKTLHNYLHGEDFTLVTDHQPLTYLMTKTDLVSMLARWAIIIQQYKFTIVHRPGSQHQNADCLSRMPQASHADHTGARLSEVEAMSIKSTISTQLAVLSAQVSNTSLTKLYDLPEKACFAETFAPCGSDMMSNMFDQPITEIEQRHVMLSVPATPHTKLLPANMRIDSSVQLAGKGGVMPNISAAFFACNSTQLPAVYQQQTEARDADAADRYQKGHAGHSDVWLDAPVMEYIQEGSIAVDTPAHEKTRIVRRSKAYVWHADRLYRVVLDHKLEVPAPHKREHIIKHAHEQHGHFGLKRTTALLLPYYWWCDLSKSVKHILSRCTLCDRINTAFNRSAPELQPLPIQGVFYRWGVDLAGPFNPVSSTGNKYVMVMIEHFTKYIDVTPIPDKLASTTTQVFLEKVLCRFGNCAEVITDQGTEFCGDFNDLLSKNLIDHRTTAPNHPQADGLAERAVQTIKRALRKFCEASETPELWDKSIPWIALGYNCSTQASTKMSPYYMLYARHPVIPPAHVHKFADAIDLHNVEAATQNVLKRAQLVQTAGIIAGENLKIAQHRDTLRYATIRGGGYLPSIRLFEVGDFVYLRRRVLDSVLQIAAKREIYRVKSVQPNVMIQLQGKCGECLTNNVCNVAPCHLPDIDPTLDHTLAVPDKNLACEVCAFMDEEDKMLLCDGCGTGWHTMCLNPALFAIPKDEWLCPRCMNDGVSVTDLKIRRAHMEPEAGPLLRGRPVPLFRDAVSRRRNQELVAFEGRTIANKEKVGGRLTSRLGVVRYLGARAGLKCFEAKMEDGTVIKFSAAEVRHRLMPAGTR